MTTTACDYRITPTSRQRAREAGLVSASWHACDIDRKTLKRLMKREDRAPLTHFALWLLLLAASAVTAFVSWGSWWSLPAFAVYGVLYAAADHRTHELWHGTPFRTHWLNAVFLHLTAFMTLREANFWRWSHARHHTDTLIVGSDREIAMPRPPSLAHMLLDLFYLHDGVIEIWRTLRHAAGHFDEAERDIVPSDGRPRIVLTCRLWVAIFAAIPLACLALGSILPALFIVLPRFYGGPLSQLFNLTQHTALAENILDHRRNCRTVKMNPVFNFLYMNMNYHIEHHMYPLVPFYRLPELHALIQDQCPPVYPSLWAAWREIIPGVLRQRRDPSYHVERPLPETTQGAETTPGHETATHAAV